jgi:hypothetical protein
MSANVSPTPLPPPDARDADQVEDRILDSLARLLLASGRGNGRPGAESATPGERQRPAPAGKDIVGG